ncbi:MAG: C-terminal binding protein [Burkholderiales bacterium]|nr:MAG: C-terminal binding protein [Burkholderiales bacterium]
MATATRTVAVLEPGYADYGVERGILGPLDVRVVPVAVERDALEAVRELSPVALMVRERPVTAEVIAACPQLRVIVRYGIGVDNIDLDAARAVRAYVANVPDYGAEHEVSDQAVALYLAVTRRVVARDRSVRAGAWAIGQRETMPGRRTGVLGLIGFGRIARMFGRKMRALGFSRVLAFDPLLGPEVLERESVEAASLEQVCRASDVVSLHTPLKPDTHHILDARLIGMLQPGAIVINVSRGGLIDEAALAAALTDGRLFGAGLDVFEHEPPATDGPIFGAPNTVLSDHTAWYSEDSVSVLQTKAAAEVERVLTGQVPLNWVNRWQ